MNEEIRMAAKKNKVKLWQVADMLGFTDSTFSRMLRYELPDDQKKAALEAINTIASSGVEV